ncbi:MAG: hypothetical protein JWM99_10, partial [Verrucomicrobiales bacterium]|nr:hypothetical protein [Verrucomicrobiales bacterium]
AGETYRVEVADDLQLPTWGLLQEIRNTENSMLQVSDSQTGGVTTKFYRVVWMR